MSQEPAMSQPSGQDAVSYEPLSAHPDGQQDDVPYNNGLLPPPVLSPSVRSSSVHSAAFDAPPDLALDNFMDHDLPTGAERPRFLGPALAQEGLRQSYASSHGSFPGTFGDGDSSIFALNPAGQRDSTLSRGYASVPYQDDPHDADFQGSGDMPLSSRGPSGYLEEKRDAYIPQRKSKRKMIIASIVGGFVVVAIAVVIAIYFTVIKKNSDASGSTSSGGSASPSGTGGSTPNGNLVTSGGDGSTVTMDDGTTFIYSNKFGGTWHYNPSDPFNNAAQPNSWTPPLNQSFRFGIDHIYGVNLGGWLVPEPFIAPALFEKYSNSTPVPVDEWTLSQAMAADTAGGGLNQLEDHYKTFITELDFAQIAGAGLNYVRIPLAYWAIEVWDGEPFLPKTSWTYFLKAIKWARKYGLRINLDFHAVPGSQNAWNHSGKMGTVNFLYGPMGMANAQRTLDYIRVITEFISQPQYKDVVTMFGVVNEPRAGPYIGKENLADFYGEVYQIIRGISGTGQGNGPMISLHEGFLGLPEWAGFMTNADRMALDIHPYLCFNTQSSAAMSTYATTPCTNWGGLLNTSMGAFGLTGAGEFSNAVTDCGQWLNGVGLGTRYEGTYDTSGDFPSQGSCDPWVDYQTWTASQKTATKQFALASMDALQNWFFWTWKIGNSSVTGTVPSPAWSYSLGLENGWMPLDPRDSIGVCGNSNPFSGPLEPWQTGGSGAGVAVASGSVVWPPTSISSGGAVSLLPTYTPTGTIVTLPGPVLTQSGGSTINAGDGWVNTADSSGMNVPIPTCSYLNPWVGSAAPPSPLCSGAAKRDEVPLLPMITPPPSKS